MALDHLIFDTTDVDTVAATHSVGAYVRSGKSGALVTNHSLQKPSAGTFAFVDGDVTPGTDTIAETAHGLQTGDKVQLTTTGVLPAGLALLTDYYVIRVTANSFKLASTAYNAEWNIPVDITAAAGGGTHTLTGMETEGRALDVWFANPSIAISATDLDIRDLVFATDKVDVSGSTVELGATTLAALETITVEQGTSPWVVSATDLDIRDLTHVSDSIKIGDGTDFLAINADGSINVNADISVVNGSDKEEDTAHASGDIGTYILSVRQDTLASSTSTDGDYASLKTSAAGALYVNLAESTATIATSDAALANTAMSNAANTLDTAGTAEAVVTSVLSDRKYLYLYNNDNTKVFIGTTGVTAANGFPVSPGSYMELRAGAAVPVLFVGQTGKTPEIRTLQLS